MHGRRVWLCLCLVLFLLVMQAGSALADDGKRPYSWPGTDEGGKNVTLDMTKPDEGYSTVVYDIKNGLPTSEANAIVQTEEGFLWIGCYSGLIRYDGNTFTRMDSTDGIASVVSLFVDSKNRVWVGTNEAGVAVIDKGEVRMFRMKDGLKSLSCRTITEDAKGNIYVGTTRGVAVINEAMNIRTLEQVNIRDAYVRELRTGADGIIYGVTEYGDVFTIEGGVLANFYEHDKDSTTRVVSIFPDLNKPGYVYLGTDASFLLYGRLSRDMQDMKQIFTDQLAKINYMTQIEDIIWLCAGNGIGYLQDGVVHKMYNMPIDKSFEHMLPDYQGNLWFTSSHAGVMKIVRNRFANISEWCGLSSEQLTVNSTCIYGDWLLLGSNNGLTVVSASETKVVEEWTVESVKTAGGVTYAENCNLIDLLDGVRIRSILRDSQGRLWFSTYGDYTLMMFEDNKITCYTKAEGMPTEHVRAICEASDGSILAAANGGVVVLRDGVVERVIGEEDGIRNTEILTVEEGRPGDYIIGTDGGGMYVYTGGNMLHYSTETGMTSDIVMRVKKSRNRDVYWIVTSNSLAYMDADYNVTTIKNFPYSNNFDLYENSKGEVWILSSNGIYVTNVDTLIADGDIDPEFYCYDNGLPYVATSNSYSIVTGDGDLYVAGSGGVTRVNIENPFENVMDLKIAVPFVVADGREIYPDEDGVIRVPAKAKKVVIHGYVFTYSLSNPLVTYKLDGFDHGETTVSRTDFSPVSYTNLSGGRYYFTIRVQDPNGVGSKEVTIRIDKRYAFYETWWFRILAVIAIIGAVSWIVVQYVRRKMQKLIEKEEEQKAFIREMTEAFAKTIDMKDRYTNGHSTRVAEYTTMLAKELGCDEEEIEKYYYIALLHDIGKIGVPAAVLNKQGKLSDDEFKIIKSHSSLGYRALKDISIMPELAIGAAAHHERPDGKGYPKGLKGDEIPRVAQIIAVADTFDAMYSDRPYRKRMNFDKVVEIIRGASGTQLAADVVDAFLRLADRGLLRAPDDTGGGTTEDIDNIHKSFEKTAAVKAAAAEKLAAETAEKPAEDKPAEEKSAEDKPAEEKPAAETEEKS